MKRKLLSSSCYGLDFSDDYVFQFGMWIGNEATVCVPFVWYDNNTSSSMQGSQPCTGQWMGGMLMWCSTSSVRESR